MMKQLSIHRLLFSHNVFDHVIQINKDDNSTNSLPATKDEVFQLVVSNYIDKVYRYINYTFWLQKHATEDIVQEIFLQLPKKLTHFDTNKQLEPRLFKVSRNTALDWIRKNKRKNDNEIELDIVATEDFLYQMNSYEGEIPQTLEQAYQEGLLRLVLHKLEERNRQLVTLYFFEHKSYEEIAIILGVKSSWVGTYLVRAKKQLKHLISQDPLLQDALIYDL